MKRSLSPALSWSALGALTIVVGCLTQPEPGSVDAMGVSDVLSAVGPAVVLPAVDRFSTALDALDLALADWAESLDTESRDTESPDSADALAVAQARWVDAMLAWQELEVMQIGPAGSSLDTVGGIDLRDEVYSWPTISPCRIDQVTVEAGWDDPEFFSSNTVNSYGLDALEHLLWADFDNACPTQTDINANGTWAALGEDGVLANRAAFSRALLSELRAQGDTLAQAWAPEGDNYSGALALDEGTAYGPVYGSEQEALNAVFDALFYLELGVKDDKLATPLGLGACSVDCSAEVEHYASGIGIAAIEANLLGFQALFTGGSEYGLDALLVDLGHGDLSDQILTDLDAALALAASIDRPLDAAIDESPSDILALHDAVKRVTDSLKGDLSTVLVLELPAEAAGDND